MAKMLRDIIEIDEERCTGCGQCVLDCAEGAIAIVDGKAKVVADIYCDGLGACLGGCPENALRVVQREADAFNEEAVADRLARLGRPLPPGQHAAAKSAGCPGSAAASFTLLPMDGSDSPLTPGLNPALDATLAACEGIPVPGSGEDGTRHWPLKIRLMPEQAPFLKGAALLVAADCAAFAAPDFHSRLADGKIMLIGCPKFEGAEALTRKLTAILKAAAPESLLVARMEVPCCRALSKACSDAVALAGADMPVREAVLRRSGEITGD